MGGASVAPCPAPAMNCSACASSGTACLTPGLRAIAIVYHPISESYPNAILDRAFSSSIALGSRGWASSIPRPSEAAFG